MSVHTLSRSTSTVELFQVTEVNEMLLLVDATGSPAPTAVQLGLSGATVVPRIIDRAAVLVVPLRDRRRDVVAVLRPEAVLHRLLAAGAPSAPYLYGVFGEAGGGRRELPVPVHTEHLVRLSVLLGLRRHLWGV